MDTPTDPPTTDSAFCQACGYSLRGLTARRCPECGRPFNPSDSATMSIGRPLHRWQRTLLVPIGWPTVLLAILGAAMLAYLSARPHLRPIPWSVLTGELHWPREELRPFTTPDLVFFASILLWAAF